MGLSRRVLIESRKDIDFYSVVSQLHYWLATNLYLLGRVVFLLIKGKNKCRAMFVVGKCDKREVVS